MVDFFKKTIAFTRRFPVLQRRQFSLGADLDDDGVADLKWFGLDGGDPHWNDAEMRTLCVQLESGPNDGLAVKRLFFILNADYRSQWVSLPAVGSSLAWHRAIDTSLPAGQDVSDAGSEIKLDPSDHYIANARSTVVLLAQ